MTTQQNGNYTAGDDITFAAANSGATINLSDISIGVFTQAIENIATLRADNGASMSRLQFAGEEMATQETNLVAAMGRITDRTSRPKAPVWRSTTISSSLGRHAVPGELEHRRRAHAPEVIKNRREFVYIQLKESNS